MIRVLQVCAVDFTVKHFLLPLIKSLEEQQYKTSVMCSRGDDFEYLIGKKVDMIEMPFSRSWNVFKHFNTLVNMLLFLKRNKYDIVHTHTPVASLIARISARIAGVSIIIYTAHGFYFHDNMRPIKRSFHVMLEKFAAYFCDMILTQSEEDCITAVKEKIIKKDKILTIGNGIDLSRFNPAKIKQQKRDSLRNELKIPADSVVVAIVGRLVHEKGYVEFFKAASLINKKYPKTYFLVIGDALTTDYDNSKQEFIELIDHLNIRSRTIFTGMRSDVELLLAASDIFCLPSHREGMPRSIIEAMALGKPVITTDIRGCREEVIDNETGYIIPPFDPRSLAEALIKLIVDRETRIKFGNAGLARAKKYYDESIVLKKQIDVYQQLIAAKKLSVE
jgi:glycosyltransferase involved in cell wall biosynthesis